MMKVLPAHHGFLTSAAALVLSAPALLLLASGPANAESGRWQSTASIAAIAESHARAKLSRPDLQIEATVNALDSRLKLARCDQPMQAFTPPNTEIRQNLVIGVRCRGSSPWKVYVPVRLSAKRQVLVTSRPLNRGATLSKQDVRLEVRDITTTRGAYLTDVTQLGGKVLKRTVPEGRLVTADLLNEEDIIKRGQRVTLLVEQAGFMVQMAGTALSDGTINERIRVENASSQRTVEGIVRSPQLVEVITY
jgi:flagella basal body P-ring formation protein FlgA